MPREDVVYTCLTWVLSAPWVLIIPLAIKPHTFLLSMICESQWVILTTRRLAEETPLPLLLSPPNRLQERAPSQGYPFDHDSLLQSERSWLARVDWRLFDLFINLSDLAQCCPQSLPAAPAPELQVHTLLTPPEVWTAPTRPQRGSGSRSREDACSGVSPASAVDREPLHRPFPGTGRAGHRCGPGPCRPLLGARSWSQRGFLPWGPTPRRRSHSLLGLQRWNIWDPLAGSI